MNNPIEPEDNLGQRIEQIEREIKRIRFALDHIKIDTGSAREALDAIERKQSEAIKLLRGIGQIQPDHSEKLDVLVRGQQELLQEIHAISGTWVNVLQDNVKEIKSEIQTMQGSQNERLDQIDTRLYKQEDLLRQILDRLPPKQ